MLIPGVGVQVPPRAPKRQSKDCLFFVFGTCTPQKQVPSRASAFYAHGTDFLSISLLNPADAIAACQPDQQIVLITDVAETLSVGKNLYIDLNSTFNQLEVKQQTLLKEFCTTWKDAVSGWNLSNILKEN